MILKSYKYRIYPTKEQEILIHKHIGASRFIYNLALETKQTAYRGSQQTISCFDLITQIKDLRNEFIWLKEINAQTLQQSIINVDKAYSNFFKNKANFPKFKSKKQSTKSFNVPQSIKIKDNKLFIPKFKKGIKINQHRFFNGIIKQCNISCTPTGKYFASILIESNELIIEKKVIDSKTTIGIDLGIKDFVITSEAEIISNPKFLKKSLSKLKYIQSKYSKTKGKKKKLKLAKLHEKVANQRKDFLHKVSSNLIKNHDTIAIETLKVKNMIQNHKLAQSIQDVSWGTFITMLEYKANWYGINIIKIGTFEPSSKTCSYCGHIKNDLKLSDREWKCNSCNSIHLRDINAAVNIKNFALRNYVSGTDTKNHVELSTLVEVLKYEVDFLN